MRSPDAYGRICCYFKESFDVHFLVHAVTVSILTDHCKRRGTPMRALLASTGMTAATGTCAICVATLHQVAGAVASLVSSLSSLFVAL